jgi:hypothetical protein
LLNCLDPHASHTAHQTLLLTLRTKPFTPQADDLIVDATVALLREHGLMDAKAMVVEDASVLLAAAEKALVIRAAEAAAREAEAAEAELAPVSSEVAHVVDALKRSPLMLTVGGDAPGLAALAGLVSMRAAPDTVHASGMLMRSLPLLLFVCVACTYFTLKSKQTWLTLLHSSLPNPRPTT